MRLQKDTFSALFILIILLFSIADYSPISLEKPFSETEKQLEESNSEGEKESEYKKKVSLIDAVLLCKLELPKSHFFALISLNSYFCNAKILRPPIFS